MPFKRKCWVLFLLGLTHLINAQSLSFNLNKIGTENGLNSLNVFNVHQFPNGSMCVTTENGVFIYNGYTFVPLKNDSLKNPTIINAIVKGNSSVFLSTSEYGVAEMDYKTNTFARITPPSYTNTPDQIIETGDHLYLLKSEIRLDILNKRTKQITEDQIKSRSNSNQAFCMIKTKNNTVLVGRSDGLYELKEDKQIKLPSLKNLPVYSITENTKGQLIIGSSSRIYIIENDNLIKEIVPTYNSKPGTFSLGGEKNITKILYDKFDRIWFTSYPNENIYVYENGITHDVFTELNMTPLLINNIYKDKDENIWLSTYDDGAYVFQNSFFKNIHILYNEKILNVNKIQFLDNLILTATGNGFYAFDVSSNKLNTISAPDNILTEPIFDIYLGNNQILYTKRSQFDLSTNIVGTTKSTYKCKPLIGKVVFPLNKEQMVIADWQANILLTNAEGNKVLDTLISFPDYRININKIYHSNDSLLIASNKGLYYYNLRSKEQKLLTKKVNQKIYDISLINSKLVTCDDEGISYIDGTSHIKQIGNRTLIGVKRIIEKNGYIWIVTTDGLFICNKQLEPIKVYNKASGLSTNYVNDISFNQEYACISTSKGISIAKIEDLIGNNSSLRPVSIDKIIAGNTSFYYNNKIIELKADDNDVSISFNSPFYALPNKQFYRYKLDNGNWSPLDNTSFYLTGLSGGNHVVLIVASFDNINWSEPTKIEFRKEVKFSETQYSFWFIILGSLILIIFISYLIVKRIKTRAIKRIQEEQQVNLLKHQAMNALLSQHFIFNSLTYNQNYINSNNSLKACEYLAKFSRLIRMIIEKASQSDIVLRDEITR